MERKLFTVSEANAAVPRLARLMPMLRDRYRWLQGHRSQVPYLLEDRQIVNDSPVAPEYFRSLLSLRQVLKEVERMGVQVKDVDSGLVDFPARLHGREVLLCWRVGEDAVAYWHDLESGFAGRQPLAPEEIGTDSETEGN